MEPNVELELKTLRVTPEPKSRVGTPNWLSHPQAPIKVLLKKKPNLKKYLI